MQIFDGIDDIALIPVDSSSNINDTVKSVLPSK